MKIVQLYGEKAAGRVALVDDEDFELVSRYRWNLWEARANSNGPYATSWTRLDGKRAAVWMHRVLTNWPGTDHIDGNGLNNQRSNLREATYLQNARNRRPRLGCRSAYKGVTWNSGKWTASIYLDGHCLKPLGRFSCEEDAARAYDAAALEHFGEFAWLNFPLAVTA